MQTQSPATETPAPKRPTKPQPTDAASVPGALLRIETVCALRGDRRTKLYDDMGAGLWPRPIKFSQRCARWPASECLAVNQARIAGKPDDEIRELVKSLEAARKTAGVPA